MNDKTQIITMLEEIFNRWEALLAGLSETQLTTPLPPSTWSVKDVIAHLMAWQQVSIARLQAAQLGSEPVFPGWLVGQDPESEEDLEQFNARIYATYCEQPWARVNQDWRDGFLRLVKLGKEIPENDLLDAEKYPWLKGYALLAVLQGSCEHHREHRDSLLDRLCQHKGGKHAG